MAWFRAVRAPGSPSTRTLSGARLAADVGLAVACLVVTLIVNLGGGQSVPLNREPDGLTVALTALTVGSIAARRRYPVAVLVVSLAGLLGLVAVHGTVGLATLGPVVAFYSVVALASRRGVRAAVVVLLVAFAVTGSLRPVDLSRDGAITTTLFFAGALMLAIGTRDRRARFDADVAAAEQRAELERERAASAATRERLRITRELHDVIGHALSVMVVQAGVAERLLDRRPDQALAAVAEIGRTGRQSLAEMRRLLGVLRDGDGEVGELVPGGPWTGLADVTALSARVEGAGLPVEVTVVGARGQVPPGIDLAAYRVVQEALTNCLRHASASRAQVSVTYSTAAIELTIEDDGQPPAPSASAVASAETGHGLAGMRERVAIYGGVLSAGPMPDAGFRVHAHFPIGPTMQAVSA